MSTPDVATAPERHASLIQDAEHSVSPEEWNRFVSGSHEATYCHLWGWREIMEDVLGHQCPYQVIRDGTGALVGVLPLVHVRAAPLGSYLLSMPFLNSGGPIGSDWAQRALVKHAVSEAVARRVDLLELRTRRSVRTDVRVSTRKLTVLLDLPETPEELWQDGLTAKVRNQIRRPMKEGMEARFGPDQLPAFYDVFSRHMRDLGTPVLPFRYFQRKSELFGPIMEVCAIYHKQTPVAGGLGFVWGDEFEITRASALRAFSRSAPNMLLYWALMERSIRRGIRTFNFGRCSQNSGTHRFKRQWGGRDIPLPWLQWSPRKVVATPSGDGAMLSVASFVWSRVPLSLANRFGPILARRLP